MDRTTKFLLAAIALALWGLLLRPVFSPPPLLAAPPAAGATVAAANAWVYVVQDGRLYCFQNGDLKPIAQRAIGGKHP